MSQDQGKRTSTPKRAISIELDLGRRMPQATDLEEAVLGSILIDKDAMMEALHVAAAIRGGASLVHGVQMMNVHDQLSM